MMNAIYKIYDHELVMSLRDCSGRAVVVDEFYVVQNSKIFSEKLAISFAECAYHLHLPQ